MINEVQILGYVLLALVTIGGFITLIIKMTKPIDDLRVVIQELKDCLKALKDDSVTQNKRLDTHGREIDLLKLDVGTLKTRMDMYHRKDDE